MTSVQMLPQQPVSSRYDWLNTINLARLQNHIDEKTLDVAVREIFSERPLDQELSKLSNEELMLLQIAVTAFSRDLGAITTDSHPLSYEILKTDLVARVDDFRTGQAYTGSTGINEVGDVFQAAIGYIGLLEANAKRLYPGREDPEKAQELTDAVVKAGARKTPSIRFFIQPGTHICRVYEAERQRIQKAVGFY